MGELTVREARRRKNLTQERLAEMAGIDQTTISDLETGRNTNPRLDTITRLAQALGIAPSKLRFSAPEPDESVGVWADRSGQTRRRRTA